MKLSTMSAQEYAFGPYRFDRRRRILLRHGSPVALGQRCKGLLETLLAAEGQVVSKSELFKSVWQSEHIEENNLAVQIAALRKVLGKSASGNEWIATVQRVGYQFVDPGRVVYQNHHPEPFTPASVDDDRPSVSVLPFANLDGDVERQYSCDLITEGILTELSRFQNLMVITHNASRSSNVEGSATVQTVAPTDAQYVIQGGVRRNGDLIRVTAQLLERASGQHLWAERFEGSIGALPEIQDQLVRQIVGTLAGRLQLSAIERARRKPATNLTAHDYLLRGNALPFDDPESAREARCLFNKAIQADPDCARAHALLSDLTYVEWWNDMSESNEKLELAYKIARKAVALDANDYTCQGVFGWALMLRQEHDLAELYLLRALELNPNRASVMAGLGGFYGYSGKPEQALKYMEMAKLLDPFFQPNWYCRVNGVVQFVARRHSEAISAFGRAISLPFWGHAYIAACYAMMSRPEDARRHTTEVLRLKPDFSLRVFSTREPYKRQVDRGHLVEALSLAGLPA